MKKAYSVCAWLLLLAVLQEAALRFIFPLPELKDFNRVHYMPPAVADRGVTAVRRVSRISESQPDNVSFTITLNEYGFRDGNWRLARAPGTARIMFVGDSFVEGDKVADDDTIPGLFQNLAEASGNRLQAMNFGVAGASTKNYVQLLADAVPWFKPDWVVLLLFANDVLDGGATGVARDDIALWWSGQPRLLEIIRMLRNRGMLPFRWNFRRIATNQPVPHPNNPFSDPEHEKLVAGFVSQRFVDIMKMGGFNPFRPGYSWWYEEMLRQPVDLREQLGLVKGLLAEDGSRLLVAYLPERRQVSNFYKAFEREYSPDDFDLTQPVYQAHQRQLAEQCAELGIPFLDLSQPLAEAEAHGNHLYWNYDDHLRAEGNRVVAAALFAAWNSLQQHQ